MKRILAALALSLASLCASAQAPFPDCKPASIADVRPGLADGGAWAYWFCSDGFSVWYTWRAVRTEATSQQMVQSVRAYVAGGPFPDVAMVLSGDDASLASLRLAVAAAVAADPAAPVKPVWVVAKNGDITTRPAYALVDGVRSTVSTSRATVGATCNCVERVVESKTVYCGVSAAVVAVCTKK